MVADEEALVADLAEAEVRRRVLSEVELHIYMTCTCTCIRKVYKTKDKKYDCNKYKNNIQT